MCDSVHFSVVLEEIKCTQSALGKLGERQGKQIVEQSHVLSSVSHALFGDELMVGERTRGQKMLIDIQIWAEALC